MLAMRYVYSIENFYSFSFSYFFFLQLNQVNEGQELCVIEAMKMQNSMIAESNGIVKKINCKINDTVEGEQILLQLE